MNIIYFDLSYPIPANSRQTLPQSLHQCIGFARNFSKIFSSAHAWGSAAGSGTTFLLKWIFGFVLDSILPF
jgi:hypothetical protein